LGGKRNWRDSDDLCVMFKAAYSDEFYHALRDALHAEVDSWHATRGDEATRNRVASLWQDVTELEPVTRNADATRLSLDEANLGNTSSQFVPLQHLSHIAREA
jgi:hypothetical protein